MLFLNLHGKFLSVVFKQHWETAFGQTWLSVCVDLYYSGTQILNMNGFHTLENVPVLHKMDFLMRWQESGGNNASADTCCYTLPRLNSLPAAVFLHSGG